MPESAHSPHSWQEPRCTRGTRNKLLPSGHAQPDAEHMSELRRGGPAGPTHSPCGVRRAERGRPVPTNGMG
jgi:hypothetical protein